MTQRRRLAIAVFAACALGALVVGVVVGAGRDESPGPAPPTVAERTGRSPERTSFLARIVPLAGREEHVLLARVRIVRDLAGEVDQPVGRVAHRRDDDADLVAGRGRLDDATRDALDLVGARDRRAAVLLDDDAHGPETYRPTAPGSSAA